MPIFPPRLPFPRRRFLQAAALAACLPLVACESTVTTGGTNSVGAGVGPGSEGCAEAAFVGETVGALVARPVSVAGAVDPVGRGVSSAVGVGGTGSTPRDWINR